MFLREDRGRAEQMVRVREGLTSPITFFTCQVEEVQCKIQLQHYGHWRTQRKGYGFHAQQESLIYVGTIYKLEGIHTLYWTRISLYFIVYLTILPFSSSTIKTSSVLSIWQIISILSFDIGPSYKCLSCISWEPIPSTMPEINGTCMGKKLISHFNIFEISQQIK